MTDEQNILSSLEQDARKLRVGRRLPDGPLSYEQIEEVIGRFHSFLSEHRLTLVQASRECGAGFSVSTLSSLKHVKQKRKVDRNLDRIARGLNAWMEQYIQRREVPKPQGFVETRVAKRMLAVILNAIRLNSMALIYGPSGVGKTMVCQAAASIYPGSVMIRVTRSTRVPGGLARQLCLALRIDAGKSRSMFDRQLALERVLKDSGRLILIDEAHQLSTEAMELVRDLHDLTGVPVVLCGTRQLNDKVSDTEAWFGQFNRRVALRYDCSDDAVSDRGEPRPLFTVAEIRRAFESDQLRLTDDGAGFLTDLSNCAGLGGLGLAKQVVTVAAATFPGRVLDRRTLFAVLRQMHPRQVVAQVQHRMQALQAIAASG